MIENIKSKIWELLSEKDVSLAMMLDRSGGILWHKGRTIHGQSVDDGWGFSKSLVKRAIGAGKTIEEENVPIMTPQVKLPESAGRLNVKSIIIQPVSPEFYLYIDSGIRQCFNEKERCSFKIIGELLAETIGQMKRVQHDRQGVTGQSEAIAKIRDLIVKYSIEEQPVLILGETGVGKSHVAEMIHQYSGRRGKFVTISTPSIPEHLLESEVFGHLRGAFSDARCDRKGYVAEAEGGTLFFDEIAEVPDSFQAKLLRFIETRKYRVLGESPERQADIRIIAATNRDLRQAIAMKQFRNDLYYRLHVLEIEIPPLRQRKKDIQSLVAAKKEFLKNKEIGPGFWDVLLNHDWPGNVRELITVLIRAGIQCESPITGPAIAALIHSETKVSFEVSKIDKVEALLQQISAGKSFWEVIKKPYLNRDLNREEVRETIQRGLRLAGGRYVDLIRAFNIDKDDYHKFMCFLNDNELR